MANGKVVPGQSATSSLAGNNGNKEDNELAATLCGTYTIQRFNSWLGNGLWTCPDTCIYIYIYIYMQDASCELQMANGCGYGELRNQLLSVDWLRLSEQSGQKAVLANSLQLTGCKARIYQPCIINSICTAHTHPNSMHTHYTYMYLNALDV